METKGFKTGLIVILCMLALGLTTILVLALSRSGRGRNQGGIEIWNTCKLKSSREIETTDLTKLNVDYSGTGFDISIFSSESDRIVLEEYFNYDAEIAEIRTEGNLLKISNEAEAWNNPGSFNFFAGDVWQDRRGYIKLYVPEELFGQLEKLEINSSSGDVYADYLQAKSVSIITTSGEQELGTCKGDFVLGSTSGDIEVESCSGNLEASTTSGDKEIGVCEGNLKLKSSSGESFVRTCYGNLDARATSGDVEIESCGGDAKINASSGKVTIKELGGGADVSTTSGEMCIGVTRLSGDITLNGSSGGATLRLPDDSAFSFLANTSSGDIDTWFDSELSYNRKGNNAEGRIGSNPVYTVRCSFTSGDVKIVK